MNEDSLSLTVLPQAIWIDRIERHAVLRSEFDSWRIARPFLETMERGYNLFQNSGDDVIFFCCNVG